MTSNFIDKIQDSFAQKDISNTESSLTLETLLEEEDLSQPSKSKLLERRNNVNCSIRRSESGMN